MSECRTCGTPSGALFTANAAGILKQCPTCNLMRPEHYFEKNEPAPLAGKEAEPTCRPCAEGMPIKKYIDDRVMHFDGLMSWYTCTTNRQAEAEPKKGQHEQCEATRITNGIDEWCALEKGHSGACDFSEWPLLRHDIAAAPAMNTEAPLVDACEKCGKTGNVCGVPVPPDTYERLCGECISFMLGEAHQLMDQAAVSLIASKAGPKEGLEELRELSEKATPGPWQCDKYDTRQFIFQVQKDLDRDDRIAYVYGAFADKEQQALPNAEFVVACVNYVRAALAGPK